MFTPPALEMPIVPGRHNKGEQWLRVSMDFDAAQHKAKKNKIWAMLRLCSNKLGSFEEAVHNRRFIGQSDSRIQIVPIADIAGSVGRDHDFDRHFMPRHGHLKLRWQSIDQAYYSGKALPPIELIQLDGNYYVLDGHHRISVARFHGQQYIEAQVVQYDYEPAWQSLSGPTAEPSITSI